MHTHTRTVTRRWWVDRGSRVRRALSGLTLLALAAGCQEAPRDGQVVGQTSSLTFSGYVPSAAQPITVEALNEVTGTWNVLGSTTSGSSPAFTAYDMDWYPFQRANVIPATTGSVRYWRPGASGFMATVRTRSGSSGIYPVNEAYPSCQYDGLNPATTIEWIERCSPGRTKAFICTSNYVPASSVRRSPCPGRGFKLRIGNNLHYLTHDDRTNITRVPPSGTNIETLGYRADATSFIDFFDRQLGSGYVIDQNLVRVRYPQSRATTTLQTLNIDTLASSLGVPITPWNGARSFRMYDTGECSQLHDWRSIISRFTAATNDVLQDLAVLSIAIAPVPQLRIRPIISESGTQDGFRFTGEYLITNSGLTQVHGLLTLDVVVRLSSGSDVVASIDPAGVIQFTEPGGSSGQFQTVFAGRSRAAMATAFRPLLGPEIAGAINVLRPNVRSVRATVERVHARVDGFEQVLAEDGTESEVNTILSQPGLRDQGFCGRPDPSPLGNQSGRFTEVRSPRGSEPVAFGD